MRIRFRRSRRLVARARHRNLHPSRERLHLINPALMPRLYDLEGGLLAGAR